MLLTSLKSVPKYVIYGPRDTAECAVLSGILPNRPRALNEKAVR
jgi:hypothetical protein